MHLVDAIGTGNILRVKACLAAGANVNEPNEYGETPLERAACNNDTQMVSFLLKNGAKIVGDWPDLLISISEKPHILKRLLKAGLDPNRVYYRDSIMLTSAIRFNYLRGVSRLLEAGADPNIREPGDRGATPIMIAAYYDHINVMEKLLVYGADINAQDYSGINALFYVRMGMVEQKHLLRIIKWLVEHGIDVNARHKASGRSILTWMGDPRKGECRLDEVDRYLLAHGAKY